MEKNVLTAVGCGVLLALGIFGTKNLMSGAKSDQASTGVPAGLQVLVDNRYAGLPTEEKGFAPHGWLTVVEQSPTWSPGGTRVAYPICPRPEWFPYTTFLGPPVPVTAVFIDPSGYMFQTAEGIRVHRDGWVVTEDGRAFRAEEKIDDMQFPKLSTNVGD